MLNYRFSTGGKDSSKQRSESNKSNRSSNKGKTSKRLNRTDTDSSEAEQDNTKIHRYQLRSQNRFSTQTNESGTSSQSKQPTSERGQREVAALGATNSQPNTREEPEPSRLTRSGAVLRRSTRHSKGKLFLLCVISCHFHRLIIGPILSTLDVYFHGGRYKFCYNQCVLNTIIKMNMYTM